ncbi:hypothetical protein [Flammeovirga aprica]|uniref:Uncharacterized protein n=1 Tax=Flammeovirga aprica JL-4 TaxID=694437 RepID=A0A7X9RZM9_9BACT|nr:hypothetical protein [Flammeovirga aprica]NME71646.1 hypothetical protein [Flammeovirga aprica JL-4]
MNKKPNLSAIEIYAEKVADTICDDFFSDNDYITGIQITKLSSIQSINLFILKRIFENWQKEAVRIQSPYFDYSAESVRTSLEQLMNALSKNIHISRLHFLPLLQKAIRDVLVLTFAPELFYEEFYGVQGIKIPMKNYLVPMFAYIKIHPKLAVEILTALQEEAGVNIKRNEAINITNNIIDHHKELQDDPKEIISLFNEIVPVGIFELHPNYLDEPPVAKESTFEPKNVDDIDIGKLSDDIVNFDIEKKEEPEPAPEIKVEEPAKEEKEEEPIIPFSEAPKEEDDSLGFETIVIEEPTFEDPVVEEEETVEESIEAAVESSLESFNLDDLTEEEPEAVAEEEDTVENESTPVPETVEPKVSVEDEVEEKEEETVAVEENGAATLQDTLKAESSEETGTTLLDKIQGNTGSSESIRSQMSINQKFLFQKELFGGDAEVMDDAIKLIDGSKDYTEAISFIKTHYAQQYDWDFTSDAVMNFISLVDMKF